MLCRLSYPGPDSARPRRRSIVGNYGNEASPASTSAWQLEQSSTHFAASARAAASDSAMPRAESANDFAAGRLTVGGAAAAAQDGESEHGEQEPEDGLQESGHKFLH